MNTEQYTKILLIKISQLEDQLNDSENSYAELKTQYDNSENATQKELSQMNAEFEAKLQMEKNRYEQDIERIKEESQSIIDHTLAETKSIIEKNKNELRIAKGNIGELEAVKAELLAQSSNCIRQNINLRQRYFGTTSEQARLLQNRNSLTRKEEKELFMKKYPDAGLDNSNNYLDTKRRNTLNKQLRLSYEKNRPYTSNPKYTKWQDYVQLEKGESIKKRNGVEEVRVWRVVRMIPAHFEEEFVEVVTIRCKGQDDRDSLPPKTRPIPRVPFNAEAISFFLTEHFCFNTTWANIAKKLSYYGLNISDSTLGDIAHRCITKLKEKMKDAWVKELYNTDYWMIDETVGKVATKDKETNQKVYKSKYMWKIRANALKLSWFIYEKGSRGAKVIKPYLDLFKGYFSTDGYAAYKIYDDNEDSPQKRIACLTHIRRYFVDALFEDKKLISWFINKFKKLFAIEAECRDRKMDAADRLEVRKTRSKGYLDDIKDKFESLKRAGLSKFGTGTQAAIKYIEREWKAMVNILKSGTAEISNNLCEQMMRHIKVNLRNSQNIGSEDCAGNFCFMYSVIESCGMNKISPIKYLKDLVQKYSMLTNEEEIKAMLPHKYNQ